MHASIVDNDGKLVCPCSVGAAEDEVAAIGGKVGGDGSEDCVGERDDAVGDTESDCSGAGRCDPGAWLRGTACAGIYDSAVALVRGV